MTVSGVERSVASGACAMAGAERAAIDRLRATQRKIDFIGGLLAIGQLILEHVRMRWTQLPPRHRRACPGDPAYQCTALPPPRGGPPALLFGAAGPAPR